MTKEKDASPEVTPLPEEGGVKADKADVAKPEVSPEVAAEVDVVVAKPESAPTLAVESPEAAKENAEAAKAAKVEAYKAEAKRAFMQWMGTLHFLSKQEAENYEKETGMHRDDIEEIANTALLNNMILSFRLVSKEAAEKMEHENAAGKSMNIKAKSASEGPANVFVPMPQAFGKVGTNVDMSDPIAVRHAKELIDKLEHVTEESLEASAAKLKEGTKDPAEKHLHVSRKPLKTKEGEQIYGFVVDRLPITSRDGGLVENPTNGLPYRSHVDYGELVFGTKRGDTYYDIDDPNKPMFTSFGTKAVPIEILTLTQYKAAEKPDEQGVYQFVVSDKAKVDQPVVGDYDQFTIGLKGYGDRGVAHNRYKSTLGVGWEVDVAVSVALIEGTKEHMGVQHGAEIANPYPEPLNGATFFIPEGGAVKIVLCKNEQEILDVYNRYSSALDPDGFDLPVNQLWGWKRDDSGKLVVDPERINAIALAIAAKQFKDSINASEQPLIDQLNQANALLDKAKATEKPEDIASAAESVGDIERRLNELQTANMYKVKLSNDLENAYRELGDAKAAPKGNEYNEGVANAQRKFDALAEQAPEDHLCKMVIEARSRAAQSQSQQQASKSSPAQPSAKEPEVVAKSLSGQQPEDRRQSFVGRLFGAATPKSRTETQGVEMVPMRPELSKSPTASKKSGPFTPRPSRSLRPSIFARSLTLPKLPSRTAHVDNLSKGSSDPTTPHNPDGPVR